MKQYLSILCVLIFVIIVLGGKKGRTQADFKDKARTQFIIDIAQNITWPHQDRIDTFYVGLLSSDTGLVKKLRNKTQQMGQLHQRPVRIKQFSSRHELEKSNIHLLYVNKLERRLPLDSIKNHIKKEGVLLMTEKYPFHKSMVNFIIQKNFELNQSKLREAGFQMNPMLKDLAVKSKKAWQNLYQRTEHKLQKAKREVEKQEKKLGELEHKTQDLQQQMQKQQQTIARKRQQIQQQKEALSELNHSILNQKNTLEQKTRALAKQQAILETKKKRVATKQEKIQEQEKVLNDQLAQIEQQRLIMVLLGVLSLLIVGLGFFIYRSYRVKKEANRQLASKNKAISRQRDQIAQQNQSITESIEYASSIQAAMLPSHRTLQNYLSDYFIMYKPKDIVSGDFYWASRVGDQLVFTAADCTGHGVPGAMMSMLGVAFLEEVTHGDQPLKASQLLDELRAHIIHSLNQSQQERIKDGMDMSLCVLDLNTNRLQFAGANNSLYLLRRTGSLPSAASPFKENDKNTFEVKGAELKADKMPVGISFFEEKQRPFNNYDIQLKHGDTIYLFSDGYPDQFGGPYNKKFKYPRFRKTLLDLCPHPADEQKQQLEKIFENWRGDFEQLDDIIVMGVKVA